MDDISDNPLNINEVMEELGIAAYKSIILTVLIVVCCYALSLLVVRRKAEKVEMFFETL